MELVGRGGARWARVQSEASSLQSETFGLLLLHARWARDLSLGEQVL
ncbi:hypothetical protein A2U01_0102870, partial [Trifolium medium]|nr:hypothetical protein [Trifolium medium]